MYIILNHYSNENTNEFDIITVQEKSFALLSDAIAFADKLFLSDKDAYGQEGCVAATCRLPVLRADENSLFGR